MYTDTPYNRLMAALNEHPKATYTRVERIDLVAILDVLELNDTNQHGAWYDEGYKDGKEDHAPTPPDALDPHRGETAWTRGHGQGDWCRVHGVIDGHTSVKQHILDQHPDIDYDQHLETAIANDAPTPPDAPEQCCWYRLGHAGPHEHAAPTPPDALDVRKVEQTFKFLREVCDLPDSSASDEYVADRFIKAYTNEEWNNQ